MLRSEPALQPGVASVYCTIVQQTHNGVELYVRQFPEMVGLTFGNIRRRFDTAVAVGFMCKAGELSINPSDEEEMPEGARLVALADDGIVSSHEALAPWPVSWAPACRLAPKKTS